MTKHKGVSTELRKLTGGAATESGGQVLRTDLGWMLRVPCDLATYSSPILNLCVMCHCFVILGPLDIQKTKIMASGPITLWEIDGEIVEAVLDFIFWAPK